MSLRAGAKVVAYDREFVAYGTNEERLEKLERLTRHRLRSAADAQVSNAFRAIFD